MKVLFLSENNGYTVENPDATLVEIYDHTSIKAMKFLEQNQPGAGRMGGSWFGIMKDGNIEYNLLGQGKKSDFNRDEYDIEYTLITGNY